MACDSLSGTCCSVRALPTVSSACCGQRQMRDGWGRTSRPESRGWTSWSCISTPHRTLLPRGELLAGVSSVLAGQPCPLGLLESGCGLMSLFSPKESQPHPCFELLHCSGCSSPGLVLLEVEAHLGRRRCLRKARHQQDRRFAGSYDH